MEGGLCAPAVAAALPPASDSGVMLAPHKRGNCNNTAVKGARQLAGRWQQPAHWGRAYWQPVAVSWNSTHFLVRGSHSCVCHLPQSSPGQPFLQASTSPLHFMHPATRHFLQTPFTAPQPSTHRRQRPLKPLQRTHLAWARHCNGAGGRVPAVGRGGESCSKIVGRAARRPTHPNTLRSCCIGTQSEFAVKATLLAA